MATQTERTNATLPVLDWTCTSDFSSLDKAIMACPQLASYKGTTDSTKKLKCGLIDWKLMTSSAQIDNVQPILKYE
jgi:hypothetical protein